MHYFHQQPLKPGIGQYSSTSTADADETPFLEMCIGRFRLDTHNKVMTKYRYAPVLNPNHLLTKVTFIHL